MLTGFLNGKGFLFVKTLLSILLAFAGVALTIYVIEGWLDRRWVRSYRARKQQRREPA